MTPGGGSDKGLDPKLKRRILRAISNGLFVLTARAGSDYGAATISWLSQASFDPPLLVAALRRETSVWDCLRRAEPAVVHVVEKGQETVAKRFFSGCRLEDGRLNEEPCAESPAGVPVLLAMPHRMHVRRRSILETGGDHDLFVLEVEALESADAEPDPLNVAESPWEYGG